MMTRKFFFFWKKYSILVRKVQSLTAHYQTKCFTSKNQKVGWRCLLHARRRKRAANVTHCMTARKVVESCCCWMFVNVWGLLLLCFHQATKRGKRLVGRIRTGMWRHDGPERGDWLGLGRVRVRGERERERERERGPRRLDGAVFLRAWKLPSIEMKKNFV